MSDLKRLSSNRKAGVLRGCQGAWSIKAGMTTLSITGPSTRPGSWGASCCAMAVVGRVALAVLGGGVFMALVNVLSK